MNHIWDAPTLLRHLSGAQFRRRTFNVAFRSVDGSIGKRDFATHWIHWYPAKMFHRIPRAILGALEFESKLVILDPFCGSGTVLLEGMLKGHAVMGVDVNPIARLISKVKTTPICPVHLGRHLQGVLRRAQNNDVDPPSSETLDYW